MDISYLVHIADADYLTGPLIFAANTQSNKGIIQSDGTGEINWVGKQGILFGFDGGQTKTCMKFNPFILNLF